MIDKATVQKIKDTADIVEVVGDYVHLIRRGGNYMGLCPFHNERTPSFSVNRRKNFCYCFSCKKGGSPVNFIMEKEGLSYHEALLHLARRYGIKVEERELTDEERRRQSERESMLVANECAMRLMEHDLTETDEGRDVGLSYLQGRGVTDEAIAAFHLGYALDRGSHLTGSALKAGYPLDVFKQLGLVGTSQQGRDYDRFRGRVIFPILNTSGKVIAFGGRDLKGGLAKYINSPESELYKKSNELYGIYQARSAIVREDKCFLVEGYMDVIGMWQSGMKNVVASSGTALTDGQIALIHRFTDNITLIYDGDAAGVKASLRGIDMLLSHKMNVKTLRLPPEDDPDSFARKNTPEEFRAYVAEHETDIIRYKAQVMLAEMKNDPQQRIAAINSVVESIAHIPDVVSRDVYIRECASLLGISEEAIAKAVAKAVAEVVEKRRRERMRREFPEAMQPTPVSAPGTDVAGVSGQPASAPALPHEVRQQPLAVGLRTQVFPLARAEQALMRYCVRYGYMPFCTQVDENGSEREIDVLEFVREELDVDGVEYTVPLYAKMSELLERMRGDFADAFARERAAADEEAKRMRAEGIREIAARDLSVDEIRREEERLAAVIAGRREGRLSDFRKDWPGRELLSHENDEVRREAAELLRERHHLSHIYSREAPAEREEDRLEILVPRSVIELKGELLDIRLKELMKELSEAVDKGDAEEEHRIDVEIRDVMTMRKEIARDMGERTLSTP